MTYKQGLLVFLVGLVLALLPACGTVTADPHDAGGTGGQGGHDVAGAGGAAGAPTSSSGGAGGETCLPYNTPGASYNVDEACGDAGRCLPGTPGCCYAHCELNSAQYVGCVDNAPGIAPSTCYASCSDCP